MITIIELNNENNNAQNAKLNTLNMYKYFFSLPSLLSGIKSFL